MARVNQIAMADAIAPTPQAQAQMSPIIQQMLQQGTSMAPVATPVEGLARMGQGALGAYQLRVQDEQRKKQQAAQGADMAYLANAVQPWTNPDTGQQSQGGIEGLNAALQSGRLQTPGAQNMVAQALLSRALSPADAKRYTVGGNLVDGQGNVLFNAPDKAKVPSSYNEFAMAADDPAYAAFLDKRNKSRTPQVHVGGATVQMPGDTVADAEAKDYGKSLIKRYGDVNERANAAEDQYATLTVLKNVDAQQGAGADLKGWLSSLATGLGWDPTKIGLDRAENPQAFRGIANQLVLNTMQAQKGPQTESDARMIKDSLTQLGNEPEANQFLVSSAMAIAERKIEMRDFLDRYRQEHGTLRGDKSKGRKEAFAAWNEYKRKTPLVGRPPNGGLPVFFGDFMRNMRSKVKGQANPETGQPWTEDDLLQYWRETYGKNAR